jgi:hypothetical protein
VSNWIAQSVEKLEQLFTVHSRNVKADLEQANLRILSLENRVRALEEKNMVAERGPKQPAPAPSPFKSFDHPDRAFNADAGKASAADVPLNKG